METRIHIGTEPLIGNVPQASDIAFYVKVIKIK